MAWIRRILTQRRFSSFTVSRPFVTNLLTNVVFDNKQVLSVHHITLFILDVADTNGDGFFDDQELEALFTKEVRSWQALTGGARINTSSAGIQRKHFSMLFFGFSWRRSMTPPTRRTICWRWRRRGSA